MKFAFTLTILCLLVFMQKAVSQYTTDTLSNQPIKSLLRLSEVYDIKLNLPQLPKSWLTISRNNQRLQKSPYSIAKRRKRVFSLTHDIGVQANISRTSTMSFYSAVFVAPTSTFVPLDGTDFFSDIQATTPEDDTDIRFGYRKVGKKFDAGISLYSKEVEVSDESLIQLDDQNIDLDLDNTDQDASEDEDDGSTYRQGIRFNTTYHLVQTQNHLLNITLEMVVVQNSSTANDDLDGFDEDDLPSKTIKSGLMYQYRKMKFGIDAKFVSSTTSFANQTFGTESIKVLNSETGFDFSDRSSISFQCHNMLNENRLSKGGYAVLRNPKLILNQARYFLITYTLNF